MNKRTKDIVGELLKADKTVTISDLAVRFKVSERTIRNDLNSINDWLGENNLSLITLGSSGRIQYKPEIEEVQKFVLENDFYSYKLSKEERKMLTAAILLSSSEYTTLADVYKRQAEWRAGGSIQTKSERRKNEGAVYTSAVQQQHAAGICLSVEKPVSGSGDCGCICKKRSDLRKSGACLLYTSRCV